MTSEQTPSPPPARPVFTVEELNRFVPGLGTIMPDVGNRMWKLYYAAKAGNWTMANFQFGEISGLMRRGATTRPNYKADLDSYMGETFAKLKPAIADKDFAAFDAAYKEAVEVANDYHDGSDHAFIVWKLPDYAPPDLDFTPRD